MCIQGEEKKVEALTALEKGGNGIYRSSPEGPLRCLWTDRHQLLKDESALELKTVQVDTQPEIKN